MRSATLGLFFLSALPGFAQPGPLDLVPAEADLAVAVRNLDDLVKKGDRLAEETGFRRDRPSQLFAAVFNFLGVKEFDPQGSAAIFLIRSEDRRNKQLDLDDLLRLVGAIPFKERDKLADDFKVKKNLKPGVILPTPSEKVGGFLFAGERHFFFSPKEDSLKGLAKRKTLRQDMSADQIKTLRDADFLVQVTPNVLSDFLTQGRTLEEIFPEGDDPAEKKFHKEFIAAAKNLQRMTAGIRVEDGLGVNLLVQFQPGKAGAFLRSLEKGEGSCNLKGLPLGPVVLAQASAGDGARSAHAARLLLQVLFKNVLESQQIVSATDRPNFVGVFSEVWQRLRSHRAALYLTRDESKHGLFSLVAILDTEDAGRFLKDMKILAKIADGSLADLTRQQPPEIDIAQLVRDLGDATYRVRESAMTRLRLLGEPALPFLDKAIAGKPELETLRRAGQLRDQIARLAAERRKELLAKDLPRFVRPHFSFVAKAENRAGFPVDIVHLRLAHKDLPIHQHMQKLLGPDWDRLRLAVHGKQVVVLLGSDTGLFDETLANLKAGKPGLAECKSLAGFTQRANPGRTAEFHLSVERMLALVSPDQVGKRIPAGSLLTSLALTAKTDHLQLDLRMPTPELKRIVKENGL